MTLSPTNTFCMVPGSELLAAVIPVIETFMSYPFAALKFPFTADGAQLSDRKLMNPPAPPPTTV